MDRRKAALREWVRSSKRLRPANLRPGRATTNWWTAPVRLERAPGWTGHPVDGAPLAGTHEFSRW